MEKCVICNEPFNEIKRYDCFKYKQYFVILINKILQNNIKVEKFPDDRIIKFIIDYIKLMI